MTDPTRPDLGGSPVPPAPRPKRTRLVWLVLGAAVVLMLGVALGSATPSEDAAVTPSPTIESPSPEPAPVEDVYSDEKACELVADAFAPGTRPRRGLNLLIEAYGAAEPGGEVEAVIERAIDTVIEGNSKAASDVGGRLGILCAEVEFGL